MHQEGSAFGDKRPHLSGKRRAPSSRRGHVLGQGIAIGLRDCQEISSNRYIVASEKKGWNGALCKPINGGQELGRSNFHGILLTA